MPSLIKNGLHCQSGGTSQVILGTVLLLSFYISGRGLGASGAVKNTVAATVNVISPKHVEQSAYYSQFAGGDKKPAPQDM